jgi:hypothetical protein
LSSIPFSHFLQPQLMASGASLIITPLMYVPYFWFLYNYGTDLPKRLTNTSASPHYCDGDKISNFPCLDNVMAIEAPGEPVRALYLLALMVLLAVINVIMTKAATKIAIWRVCLAFLIVAIVAIFAGISIAKMY